MRKFSIALLFIIFLISTPHVFADWFYNSQNLIVNIDMYGQAEVKRLTPSGYIDTATVNLTFFPKETDSQEVLKFDTVPEADVGEKTVKFTWKRPDDRIYFTLNAEVKTINTLNQVRKKVGFPIEEIPDDIIIYTKPSITIDSDDEDIIRLASELVKGEDDFYAAVFRIADWTKNNINYNLSTLTTEVSQKASWVLQNKQGVCDELTSLFIALLRAVGIPARFASGVAYTESELFPEKWGPHGWAEVYFPDYGWIPFDVTYGQFGWIDPTHIKFKDSVDSDEPSTYYQWLGRNADLETQELNIKTELLDNIGKALSPIRISPSTLKDSVSFGSYNLVEVVIENLEDFYYATELYLNMPRELKLIGSEAKSVLLLPGETKNLFWIFQVDKDLDRRYSYTFPLVVRTSNNITSQISFDSSIREEYTSFEEIEQVAKLLEEEKEKEYSGNVFLDCNPEKNEFYEFENIMLFCNARNTGNIFLEDVDICFESKCYTLDLGISQAKDIIFEINKTKVGFKEELVSLRNNFISKTFKVNLKINDVPKIEIEELQYPINISYKQNFTVYFTLSKKSLSNPKNVEIIFEQNGIKKRWNIEELSENRKFTLKFEGNQLKYGENENKIYVKYHDDFGNEYGANKVFSIMLTDANLFERISLSFNRFANMAPEMVAIILLTGTMAFIGVVLVLFSRLSRLNK